MQVKNAESCDYNSLSRCQREFDIDFLAEKKEAAATERKRKVMASRMLSKKTVFEGECICYLFGGVLWLLGPFVQLWIQPASFGVEHQQFL